jgi:hypothetical protein
MRPSPSAPLIQESPSHFTVEMSESSATVSAGGAEVRGAGLLLQYGSVGQSREGSPLWSRPASSRHETIGLLPHVMVPSSRQAVKWSFKLRGPYGFSILTFLGLWNLRISTLLGRAQIGVFCMRRNFLFRGLNVKWLYERTIHQVSQDSDSLTEVASAMREAYL